MSENDSIDSRRKALEAEKARIERELADMALLQEIAARYNYTVSPSATRSNEQPAGGLTVDALAERYYDDPRSPFVKLRFATKRNYKGIQQHIRNDCGSKKLGDLRASDIEDLYRLWAARGKPAMAHSLATSLRILVNFGSAILEDPECQRLSGIMHNIQLPTAPRRTTEPINEDQVKAIIRAAHAFNWPSVALAQAMQFELGLRQKDIIGEWVPINEEGVSGIIDQKTNEKWLRGVRWEEVENLVLRHKTSWEQTEITIDLRNYKLVMDQIKIIGIKKTGPMILSETHGRAYHGHEFRYLWRKCANAAKIPRNVKNMDSYEKKFRSA